MPENPEITWLLRDVQIHEGKMERAEARIIELQAEIAAWHTVLGWHENNLRSYMQDWPQWRRDRMAARMEKLGIHLDVFSEKPKPKKRGRRMGN